MSTVNTSHTFHNVTNTSVIFTGHNDRLAFIGSSSTGVIAEGQNQVVSLTDDSWMVVQNQSKSDLKLLIRGTDSNITVNDMTHNIQFILDRQGPYSLSSNTTGPIGGVFITTAHSSIFVMGISATDLAHHVTAVG